MTRKLDSLTYKFRSTHAGGCEMVGTCHKCGWEQELTAPTPHNPERIEKLFQQKGWSFSKDNRRRCICPSCLRKAAEEKRERRQAAAARRTLPVISLSQAAELITEATAVAENEEPDMNALTHAVQPVAAVPGPTTFPAPRPLTPAEKSKVRTALDLHYDEANGCYTGGYSDQKIGRELAIPWASVAQMREAAYGPLLVDPEVEDLREEQRKIAEALKGIENRITAFVDDAAVLSKSLTVLDQRIDRLRAARR